MISKLSQWLEKQGFSLELRTAAAFRKAGFNVRQAAHYYDRAEGKDREIDLVVSRESRTGIPLVHFAVECKSSDKPWIVLISADTLSGINQLRCWGILTHKVIDVLSQIEPDRLAKLPWYATGDECGYNLRKAFSERDDGFAASIVACRAAQYLVLHMQADQRVLPEYAISFPVIVVDSPLFECRLRPNGDLELTQVKQSEVLFEDHVMFDTQVRIRVIHSEAIEGFAAEAYQVAENVHTFLAELPALRSEAPERPTGE
jgi:hypothetical protein